MRTDKRGSIPYLDVLCILQMLSKFKMKYLTRGEDFVTLRRSCVYDKFIYSKGSLYIVLFVYFFLNCNVLFSLYSIGKKNVFQRNGHTKIIVEVLNDC